MSHHPHQQVRPASLLLIDQQTGAGVPHPAGKTDTNSHKQSPQTQTHLHTQIHMYKHRSRKKDDDHWVSIGGYFVTLTSDFFSGFPTLS